VKPLKTTIAKEGQLYVDKPIHAEPANRLMTPIAMGISKMFHGEPKLPPRILLYYEHTKLNWVKRR
jgi:hypothetical protein